MKRQREGALTLNYEDEDESEPRDTFPLLQRDEADLLLPGWEYGSAATNADDTLKPSRTLNDRVTAQSSSSTPSSAAASALSNSLSSVRQLHKTHQRPGSKVLNAIYALCSYDAGNRVDCFLGSCVAIAPHVVISAGHHYRSTSDAVDNFCVVAAREQRGELAATSPTSSSSIQPRRILAKASYLQKSTTHDVLIAWLDRPLPFIMPLRSLVPSVGAPVWTVWLHKASYETEPPALSPGTVSATLEFIAQARGVITDKGSSGAPVICAVHGDLLGLHLGSNCTSDGNRITEFVTARTLTRLIAEAGIDTRRDRRPR